uniref:ATP synthase F0 subunit 8 n=1 Tax=Phintella cavaleriei TaxID=1112466 RepID=A0A8A9WEK2_9ARAC|nr:ATP synthase F0 subunit 8 [Phintella cavaleriei]QTT58088.1 ATP synthase F0 subunit 8 [Phintella cavaleriei]
MMPMFWVISMFMWILLLSVLIDMYHYNINYLIITLNNKYDFKMNYLW